MFKQNVFLIGFYQIFILQGYGKTLLHQRRSEADVLKSRCSD